MNNPPELILLKIFSHLSVNDLRQVATVNRQWNNVAYDASLWCHVDLYGLRIAHPGFQYFIDRISNAVKRLNLGSCKGLTQEDILEIFNKCSRLTTLSLHGSQLSATHVLTFQGILPEMRNLDLRFVHGDTQSKIFTNVIPNMPNLECLGLDSIPSCANYVFRQLPKLRIFHCQNCASITDEDVRGLSFYCHNLESLNLAGCIHITGTFLPEIIIGCPKLKTLLLSCTRLRNNFIIETDWTNSSLTEMDISYCYGISERGLLTLLPSLSRLKYLQVSFCGWGRALTNDVITAMSEARYSSLEAVDIHSSFNLSGHALCKLLAKCPTITTLCVGSAINSDAELENALMCLPKLKSFFITKQSVIRTETVFSYVAKYCRDIEILALYNFYAINRPNVENSLVELVRKCRNLKTLCIRGTNVPLRTELAILAAKIKIAARRSDVEIVRSPHMLLPGPSCSLDNIMGFPKRVF